MIRPRSLHSSRLRFTEGKPEKQERSALSAGFFSYRDGKMRRFIIGDIHARFASMISVLKMAGFKPECDTLYSVGDICDRGEKAAETIVFLRNLPDFRPVLGNHDVWLEEYLLKGRKDDDWMKAGGLDTIDSLKNNFTESELKDIGIWLSAFPVLRIEDKDIIVHGGIPAGYDEAELVGLSHIKRPSPLTSCLLENISSPQTEEEKLDAELQFFLWDRDYLFSAMKADGKQIPPKYKDRWNEKRMIPPLETERTIWSGHSQLIPEAKPFISPSYHLIALDTGAGSGKGKLTLFDMDLKEYWQEEIL